MREYEDEFANTDKRDNGTSFHSGMDAYYQDMKSGVEDPIGVQLDRWKPREPKVANWVHDAIAWSESHLEPRCEYIHSEVYVAYNFTTGDVHHDGTVRDRKYPKLDGYLPGTCDLACVLLSGRLLVADWKTGGGTGADKQLLTLALGLRKLFPWPDGTLRAVTLSILYTGEKVNGVHPVEWDVTDDELELHRSDMLLQLMDVGVRTEAVPGIHCTQLYCNHLAYCPGITATVEGAAESPQGLLPKKSLVRKYDISEAPTGARHAGAIMERVTAAKRQLDFYEKRVRAYCDSGGEAMAGDFQYSKGKDGFRWRAKK